MTQKLISAYDVVLNEVEQKQYETYCRQMKTAKSKEEVVHFYHLALFVLKQAKPIDRVI